MHINHIAHMYHRNRSFVQRNSSLFSSKIKRSALAVFVGLPKLCWQAMQLAMQILSQTRSFNTLWDEVSRNNSFYPWIAPFRWEGVCVYQKHAFVDFCKKKETVTFWLFNPTGCETQYVRFLFGQLPSSGERVSFIYQKQCIWPQGTTLTDTCCG